MFGCAPDFPVTVDSPLREIGLYCVNNVAIPCADGRVGLPGWHVSTFSHTIEEVADKLADRKVTIPEELSKGMGALSRNPPWVRPGEVVRLALVAHGDVDGILRLNATIDELGSERCSTCQLRPAAIATESGGLRGPGSEPPCGKCFDHRTVFEHRPALEKIAAYLRTSGATVFLLNCLAGKDDAGTKLLLALGTIFGKQHKIVGFNRRARMQGLTSIDRGFWRRKETCTPAGVTIIPVGIDWGKTETPAAEDHWSAKVVVGDRVEKWPDGEGPNAKAAPPMQMSTPAKAQPPSREPTQAKDDRPIKGFHPGKKGQSGRRDPPR